MYDVTAVGIMVADVIIKPVNAMPAPGKLAPVDSIELHSGGNAMTAAINITRLGQKTALIGKVGNDAFGQFLISCLDKSSVESKGVMIDECVQTSVSAALIAANGERSFLHCKGANSAFDISDIDMDIIRASKTVFVTGAYLMDTFDGSQTAEFMKKCKDMKKTTALDVCWNAGGSWEQIYQSLPYTDIFMPSIDEAECISGKNSLHEMAETFFDHGAGCVVIKCGSKGCYIQESPNAEGMMIGAYPVDEIADTTGAGDSFCSGFLAAYSRGCGLRECAEFANAVGACSIMKRGATEGVRSYEETIRFMENRNERCR